MGYAASPSRAREALRAVHARIEAVPLAPTDHPGSPPLVDSLAELFGSRRFFSNRPAKDAAGTWHIGPNHSTDEAFAAAYDDLISRAPAPFLYDPLHPEGAARNDVRLLRDLHTHGPDETCPYEDVWPKLGVAGWDQIRVLVCDGPTLLAWVGGFRAEAYTDRDRALFSSFVPPLQRGLALQRRLQDAQLATAGLEAALEALGTPAFVAYASGEVVHASASGRELLERHPSDTRAALRHAIARRTSASFTARLAAPGAPDCYLVILRDHDGTLESRLAEASRRWRLTARECEVLRAVVDGDAGKEIALKLRMHERHVTHLLKKARCDSRSRLIARFWTRL